MIEKYSQKLTDYFKVNNLSENIIRNLYIKHMHFCTDLEKHNIT